MTTSGPDLEARLAGVEGWFHADEARALHDAIAGREGPLRIVEIGSWKGRSTITMATALEQVPSEGVIVAIDPHTGNVEHQARYGVVDTYEEFQANIELAGVSRLVRPVRDFSHAVRPEHPDPIDVLFIDGSHEYEDVQIDLDDWLPLVREGGLVVLNDTSWPGVHRAVTSTILTRRGPWRRGYLVRSTLFVERVTTSPWTRSDELDLLRLRVAMWCRQLGGRVVHRLPRRAKSLGNLITVRLTRRTT